MKIHFNYVNCGFEVNGLGRKLGSFKMEKRKRKKELIEQENKQG